MVGAQMTGSIILIGTFIVAGAILIVLGRREE
jgi:hypothetical protein